MIKTRLLTAALVMSFTSLTAASEVADFFAKLSTFSGNFSQTVYQDGKLIQDSVGKVKLKQPLKFRWDYQTPEPMQLISDGQRFYHYDIGLAQASGKPTAEIANTALATMLSDSKQIDQAFSQTVLSSADVMRQFPLFSHHWLAVADTFYALTPKDTVADDIAATHIVLGLNTDKQLMLLYSEDAYGKTIFIFDDVLQNADIDDKLFQFNPPRGVDVLE